MDINKKSFQSGKYELNHNPGYDFKRFVDWMNEDGPIPPYFVPVLALLGACFSIEGYIDMVDQEVNSECDRFDASSRRLKERLEFIYSQTGKRLDCGSGLWQEVLSLFKIRQQFVHPVYRKEKKSAKVKF